MAERSKQNGLDVYTISSSDGGTRMSFVPTKGGAGSSLIMTQSGKERELLFQHEYFWDPKNLDLPGGWPFIFPICARIERQGKEGDYLYDGRIYNLPIHGFSSRMPWQVRDMKNKDQITLGFTDSPATREVYPFNFDIELTYKISRNSLVCEQTYTNTGSNAMPYYAGFHPYFLTPSVGQGKERILLNYRPVRHLRYNERLTDIVGADPLFPLPIAVTDPRVHEQLVVLGDHKVITLSYPDALKLNMEVLGKTDKNMFSYVQVYSPSDQPFVCVEPWMSFPNALNSVFGVRWLKSHSSENAILKLWV